MWMPCCWLQAHLASPSWSWLITGLSQKTSRCEHLTPGLSCHMQRSHVALWQPTLPSLGAVATCSSSGGARHAIFQHTGSVLSTYKTGSLLQALKLKHPDGHISVVLQLDVCHSSIVAEVVRDGQTRK